MVNPEERGRKRRTGGLRVDDRMSILGKQHFMSNQTPVHGPFLCDQSVECSIMEMSHFY